MQYISYGRTITCDLDDATQYSTLRTHGVVKGLPEGTPIATLQRARVLDHKSPRWQLFDTDGELIYSWRYSPPYQDLLDSAARALSNKEVIVRLASKRS